MSVPQEKYPDELVPGLVLVSEPELALDGLVVFAKEREIGVITSVYDYEAEENNSVEDLFDDPIQVSLDGQDTPELELLEQAEKGIFYSDSLDQYMNLVGNHRILTPTQVVHLSQLIEKGVAAEGLKSTLEQEDNPDPNTLASLSRQIEKGKQAKHTMIECNQKLVLSIVKHYQDRGVALPDLMQEGNFGLNRAVEKFDWRRGFRFSTYATWWIRQSARRAIAKQSRVIYTPTHIHDHIITISKVRREAMKEFGYNLNDEEIAELTGLTIVQIKEAKQAQYVQPTSLNRFVGNNSSLELGDWTNVAANREAIIDNETSQLVAQRFRQHGLSKVLSSRLNPDEIKALVFRFGLIDDQERTLNEVAEAMGTTRHYITDMIDKAIKKLRDYPEFRAMTEDEAEFESIPEPNNPKSEGFTYAKRAKELKAEGLIIIDELGIKRSLVVYYLNSGKSQEEIAKELQCKPKTIIHDINTSKRIFNIKSDPENKALLAKVNKKYQSSKAKKR